MLCFGLRIDEAFDAVTLILFDIDGTLMRCGVQVRPIFEGALRETFGRYQSLEGYQFAGKTDPQIVLDLVAGAGLSRDEIVERLPVMREAYRRRLAEELRIEGMRLLPGVLELLNRLVARDDVVVALLTGNWQACASIKLARFELGRFFAFGAFGDDGPDRRDLVPAAWQRAEAATGRRFAPAETLIIGDSELDVDCAQASGVASLAVATGFTTPAALRDAGADWVFQDLVEATRAHPLLSAGGS